MPLHHVRKTLKKRTLEERIAILEGAIAQLVALGSQSSDALAYTVGASDGDDFRDALLATIRAEITGKPAPLPPSIEGPTV